MLQQFQTARTQSEEKQHTLQQNGPSVKYWKASEFRKGIYKNITREKSFPPTPPVSSSQDHTVLHVTASIMRSHLLSKQPKHADSLLRCCNLLQISVWRVGIQAEQPIKEAHR